MPLCHIVDMMSSRHHEMMVEMLSHISVSLRDLQPRVSITPGHSGEGKKRKLTVDNLTDRLRMI